MSLTEDSPPPMHTPPTGPTAKRPKGILKNSYRGSHSNQVPTYTSPPPTQPPTPVSARPDLDREKSEKDITLQNTLQNAGHRRSSSVGRPVGSRRVSSNNSSAPDEEDDDNVMRLKWDEANLYLTEQEKSSTMKIDEPKTPYAKRYDPTEDEEEMRTLDADDICVDELDKVKAQSSKSKLRAAREDDIPGLSLGEPEEAVPDFEDDQGQMQRSSSQRSEKAVHVNDDHPDNVGLSAEEREKHRKFEEMRKKHYEMKNVANLLGHHEDEDGDDEDDDGMNGTAS